MFEPVKVRCWRATLSGLLSATLFICQLLIAPLPNASAAPVPPLSENGIHVGQTKLFDERSLALMLQSVQAKLANRDFFDQGSIAAAIGKFQGARLDTSSFGFNVTTTPLPGVQTTTNTGTTTTFNEQTTQPSTPAGQTPALPGVVTTNNVVTPNTINQVVTQPSVAPSPAALPPQTSAFAFQPPFSLAPQTLLSQQMELTHDLENLRLLLEGSLTDRVINLPIVVNGQPRATFTGARSRAIAGFQISLDSPKRYENAVAEVEITVTSGNVLNAITGVAQPPHDPPSLTMLLPQENNYNVATITKNAHQFGFGVAVQPISLGLSAQTQKETLYLVQDTDTIAFEREKPMEMDGPRPPYSITFGWQFRPVLGQKVVKAGPRQVYATLALPNGDFENFRGVVEVHTHWRRYDPKNKTVGDIIKGSSSYQQLDDLVVPAGYILGQPLQPNIINLDLTDAGQGNALVVVTGENFLPGMSIIAGEQIIDNAEKGLYVQGEKNFRWLISGQKLASIDDPLIAGRFGPPVVLRSLDYTNPTALTSAGVLKITNVSINQLDADNSEVTVTATHTVTPTPPIVPTPPPDFPDPVVVLIGTRAYGFSDAPLRKSSTASATATTGVRTYTLKFVAPTRSLQGAGEVVIKRLFFGPDFKDEYLLSGTDFFTASKVTVMSSGGGAKLAISGSGFTNDVNTIVIVDGATVSPGQTAGNGASLRWNGPTLLTLTLPDALSKSVKQIAVTHGTAAPIILSSGLQAPAPPKPSIINIDSVSVNDEVYTKVFGENLGSVEKVLFQGAILKFKNVADDGKTMEILVTKEMTDSKGRKAIDFVSKDGKEVSGTLVVVP